MRGVKNHYENYWSSKGKPDEFFTYERNLILPELFKEGDKVLDVGCGDGAIGEFLIKKFNVKVCGVDISEKALSVARGRGVDARLYDVEKPLPYKEDQFDVVFWGDNVEHLFKPENVLREIKRVLKPGGRLILSCPNMGYWRYRLYYLFHGRLADSEWSGMKPWAWGHIRFFNKELLSEFLSIAGFRVKRLFGISRRRLDRPFLQLFPSLFGMIFVIEAA